MKNTRTLVTKTQMFNGRGGANRRGVHLGVIEHYLSKVVGHYLNTLFLVRNTKHTGIISVVMYLTFIVDFEGLQNKNVFFASFLFSIPYNSIEGEGGANKPRREGVGTFS